MYDYEFYKIEINPITLKEKENHRDVILKYAKKGWKLSQIYAPSVGSVGTSKYCELIFEKEM